MSTALNTTFRFLAKTENESAVEVLVKGLDCLHSPSQHGALSALLDRRAPDGHREVFRRLPTFDESCREIINERPERLVAAVSAAVQQADTQGSKSACEAIITFKLFDALPALVEALSEPGGSHTDLLATTILRLTEAYYAELSGVDDQPSRKNQDVLRQRITASLESATRKFHRHQRTEPVEAYLLVAKPKGATFRAVLQRSNESCYKPIIDVLTNSSQGGVIRLLLGFLDDPQMPLVVTKVFGDRCDAKFIHHLAQAVGPRPLKAVVATLARLNKLAWATPEHPVFDELDEQGQAGAVWLLTGSSVNRPKVLEVLAYLLAEGKPAGRREAAKALAQFDGAAANALAIKSINDDDPGVRAEIIKQLRPRKIPAAFSLLIRLVDNPEPEVQEALCTAMPEFNIRHFLDNFNSMPEALQPVAGHLVTKVDETAIEVITSEMQSQSPVRRRRATLAAIVMGVIPQLEEFVILLLTDEDHMVRIAAAKALADCKSVPTWEALRDALLDRSTIVQEAAEQSLERISISLMQSSDEDESPETQEESAEQQPNQEKEEATR